MSMTEKVHRDPEIGLVVFKKILGSHRVSIRVHRPRRGTADGNRVTVTMPYLFSFAKAMEFFQSKREWVLKSIKKQDALSAAHEEMSPEQLGELRKKARAELPSRIAELAAYYGFTYNRLALRNNVSNWGSCSSRNNINLNIHLARIPAVLRDYVILHELCHLRHHDHGQAFHLLLEHLLTDLLLKYAEAGDAMALSITRRAARSLAASSGAPAPAAAAPRFPLTALCSAELRRYPLR